MLSWLVAILLIGSFRIQACSQTPRSVTTSVEHMNLSIQQAPDTRSSRPMSVGSHDCSWPMQIWSDAALLEPALRSKSIVMQHCRAVRTFSARSLDGKRSPSIHTTRMAGNIKLVKSGNPGSTPGSRPATFFTHLKQLV